MERNARNDLPLIVGSVVGLILSGVIVFLAVDVAIQSEQIDSNSPNATTPGPPSSRNIR